MMVATDEQDEMTIWRKPWAKRTCCKQWRMATCSLCGRRYTNIRGVQVCSIQFDSFIGISIDSWNRSKRYENMKSMKLDRSLFQSYYVRDSKTKFVLSFCHECHLTISCVRFTESVRRTWNPVKHLR